MRRGRGRRGRGEHSNGFAEFGGYMAAKKQKLEAQFTGDIQREKDNCSASSGIFEGVTIHVNGYTVPSSDELKRLMQLHGGAYQHYYGKTRVTHIIATMLPHTKLKKLTDEKVVRPEWILDSIEAGELLDCESYLLFSQNSGQKTLNFSSTKPSSTATQPGNSVKDNTQTNSKSGLGLGSGIASEVNVNQIGSVKEGSNQVTSPTGISEFKTPQRTQSTTSQQQPSGSKPARLTAKAGDPSFVSEFYNNSRLHHISTWGAEFKAYVTSLQSKGSTRFPGREKLKRMKEDEIASQEELSQTSSDESDAVRHSGGQKSNHVVMHVDMDCFFVSVGLIDRPELRGKPVAVTHSKGRGMPVLNQEAREYERAYYQNKYGDKSKQKSGDITNLLKRASSISSATGNKGNVDNDQDDTESHTNLSGDDNEGSSESESFQSTSKPSPSTSTKPSGTTKQSSSETFSSMAEIASCSYEARKAGIRNGMFLGRAGQLCPDLQMIPYDFDGYKRVSQTLYETVASYTHDIEAVSCDEMFVDITSVLEDTGASPMEFAGVLRKEIWEKTKCPASAGLASNILLARMSTRVAKPDGQFYLEPDAVQDFIKKQPVKDLPGVGWSTSRRLQAMGLNSCEELQQLSIAVLQKEFGPKTGQSLHQYCRGIDDRPIKAQHARKSVSAEINYGIRFKEDTEAINFVTELAKEVHKRLQAINMMGKVVTLKLKVRQEGAPKETSKFLGHGVCDNISKSVSFATPTESVDLIIRESVKLLRQVKAAAVDMRGVGIQISHLTSKSAASSSGSIPGNKSLLDFVNKEQSNLDSSTVTNAALKPSTDTTTTTKKAKPHIPTMLDYIAKQPQSEINKDNKNSESSAEESIDKTPTRNKELPPLPTLPDFKTPSESGTPVTMGTRRNHIGSETPVTRVTKTPKEFSMPTPSQLDESVLSALPEEIRCQVLANYKSEDIKRIKVKNRTSNVEDEPSTSTGITHHSSTPSRPQVKQQQWDPEVLAELPEDIVAEIMEGRGQDTGEQQVTSENIEALPNISQIDPSCLEALPPELQKELQDAYDKQTKTAKPPLQQTTPKKTNPPRTKTTPNSASKRSPFKINRRRPGRPRKNSPAKKLYQRSANQPGILEMITGSPGVRTMQGKETNAEDKTDETDLDKKEDEDRDHQDMEDQQDETPEPVNLCGAVRLQDVKNLLKEWMFAFSEPLDEDVHHIVDYLYQLILDRNMEMVDLVLRAVKRLSDRCGKSAWIEAYSVMEDKIQDIVYETYGSRLKLQTV